MAISLSNVLAFVYSLRSLPNGKLLFVLSGGEQA
ncbi:MAG: hypothetical protein ACFWTY_21560 [Shouchella clausii]|nr:hypothetical protein SAMN05192535_1272 [Shouchella rhizosphaerae]